MYMRRYPSELVDFLRLLLLEPEDLGMQVSHTYTYAISHPLSLDKRITHLYKPAYTRIVALFTYFVYISFTLYSYSMYSICTLYTSYLLIHPLYTTIVPASGGLQRAPIPLPRKTRTRNYHINL